MVSLLKLALPPAAVRVRCHARHGVLPQPEFVTTQWREAYAAVEQSRLISADGPIAI